MQSLQKHIINKLTVDVETQNPRTAFDLKDNIDTFLKNEILPHLEDYFSSITEDLHSHTIQIPYLSVNVDTSSVLNYKELKEDVKKEIIKEVKQVTNPIKAVENDVVFIKRNESKEQSILHFLEQGTNSWWIGSEDSFYFDNEEFSELLKSKNFQDKLKQKLKRKEIQNRFVSQLNNEQIHQTLLSLFQSDIDFLLEKNVIKNIGKLSLKSRATIWEYLIDFAMNKNRESLATKLIFELTELIPESKKQKAQNKTNSRKTEENSPIIVNAEEKHMTTTIIRLLAKIHKAKETRLTSEVIDLITANKVYYNEVFGLNIKELALDNIQLKKTSNLVHNTNVKTTPTSILIDSADTLENTNKTQKELEPTSSEEVAGKLNTETNPENIDTNLKAKKNQKGELEKAKGKTEKSKSLLKSKETENRTSIGQDAFENREESEQKLQEKKNTKDYIDQEGKKALHKNRDDKEKNAFINNEESIQSLDQIETVGEKLSKVLDIEVHDPGSQNLENEIHENEEKEPKATDKTSNDLEKEFKNLENKIEKSLKEGKGNSNLSVNEGEKVIDSLTESNEISKDNSTKATTDETSLTKEEISVSSKKLKESMNNLIKEKDRILLQKHKTKSEEKEEKEVLKGDYQINNAGLILLHPYLGHFFQNCNVLNENNEITNPDLAVHLLHYLATKQEQQFESNMLFEKILCGVPLKKTIQRNIELSDELKSNAEELLQAALDNWGVLKNASPDLLRGEFLQRFGKISFKEVNPKITIERKVYDILLEKLPWNIGISRLPWLDYLLFTDW